MTTPTKKRVVRTPFDQLLAVMNKHWSQPIAGRSAFDAEQLESIKAMASELPLVDVVEDVPEPPKTDGELMLQATDNCSGHVFLTSEADDIAAEFLRLLRERDGEPLDVTKEIIADWYMEWRADQDTPRQSEWFVFLTAKINAHRGVRPVQIPQVTAEMLERVLRRDSLEGVAESLNAELASQPPQPAPVAQPVERPEPVTVEWVRDVCWNIPHADLTILVDKINAHFGAGKVGG